MKTKNSTKSRFSEGERYCPEGVDVARRLSVAHGENKTCHYNFLEPQQNEGPQATATVEAVKDKMELHVLCTCNCLQ